MIQPHQAGSYSILEGIENRLMPEVQAVGDQAYPAERSPLEEAFDRTCIKENDHDATAIGHREAKLIGPTEGLEQAGKYRPNPQNGIGIVAHRHEQESQDTGAPQPRAEPLYPARVFLPGVGVTYIGITEDKQHPDSLLFLTLSTLA